MPRAGEGAGEAVGQEGVVEANAEPEEVAPWEMVTREALTEVGAEKRVEKGRAILLRGVVRSCRMLGCTKKRHGLRASVWMSPTRIDGCERSTSPICFQIPPKMTRRGLMSSVQMFRNQSVGTNPRGLPMLPNSFTDDADVS